MGNLGWQGKNYTQLFGWIKRFFTDVAGYVNNILPTIFLYVC
jgi:hypothetical protein